MLKRILKSQRGFTLIELMIVVTIIGILAAISAPNYQWGIIRAREAVLREDLYTMRSTIDQYYADQGKYPETLQELVDNKNRYLREIPKDPFTKSKDTWVVTAPPATETPTEGGSSGVYDVHSGSTLVGSDGKPYNEW
ncbi:type IV pilin protein [Geomonas paludis]|nr:prepilin-type N-terminal cleavage/methylation domain-containing protein [Geomonas paludis]